jgi:HEAT repeat protein
VKRIGLCALLLVLVGCRDGTSFKGQPLEYWLAQLRQPDAEARYQASIALGKIGKPAVPALREVLHDPDPACRLAAAQALAKMYRNGIDALPDLIPLLHDPDPSLQAAAAKAIGHMDQLAADAVPDLIPLLSSPASECRYYAVDALCRIGPKAPSAVPALCKLLKDPDLKVRRLVAQRLGNTRSQDAIPALIAALDDEDRQVVMGAGFSLRKIDPEVGAQYGYW